VGGGRTVLGKSSNSFQIIQTDLELMEDNMKIMEDDLKSMEDDQKCPEGQIKNLLGPALYRSCTSFL
jgi:hypothetical protein